MEKFIKDITKKAGRAILKKFGKIGVKYTKRDAADVVTEADLISNSIIVNAIKKNYPSHGIISEESGDHQKDSEYVWIIDPLDGTRNFSRRTPLFAVQICLVKKGKVEIATIYNPYTEELFFAQRGRGAFLNGTKIHCSNHKTWKDSWGVGSANISKKSISFLGKILSHSENDPCWISALGSVGVSAMYVADGRRDWQISGNGQLWDYAPLALVLQEAGCKVTNFKGKPWSLEDRELVAANKHLHAELIKILNSK